MRIGLLASNASLAEYFVIALAIADHAAVTLQGEAPHDVLLLELIVDERERQTLAWLSGLARELGLRIIVLTTAGRDTITLTQPALPALCLRQLPLPLGTLLALIQAHCPSESSSALSSFGSKADAAIYS